MSRCANKCKHPAAHLLGLEATDRRVVAYVKEHGVDGIRVQKGKGVTHKLDLNCPAFTGCGRDVDYYYVVEVGARKAEGCARCTKISWH